MNETLTAILTMAATFAASSVIWYIRTVFDDRKRQKATTKAAKPPRVFADHARDVLKQDFEKDVEEIQDAVKGDDAVNSLVQMGNSRSRRED